MEVFKIKITISEFKRKYPKLIRLFEKENRHYAFWANKITKSFIYWLHLKLKYKTLICDEPTCPKLGLEFLSIISLAAHKRWHDPKFRERMTGKNHPNYGKQRGYGYYILHTRVKKRKPKPELCEICGLPEFYENLGRIELSNKRNHQYTDNPNDYQYIHMICHFKYDKEKRHKN